jgi:L,D-transpeptidase YcbB
MESNVIVGKPATPTPTLSSKIDCFVVFPYWYVPRKITVEEYLSVIKKDTTFITRNNFDVLDRKGNIVQLSSINWNQYNANNFPFVLRQREGTENSLGIIKFVFDNPHAVFLHDTNAKKLFRNDIRAYSHGCIRLEKAFQLAHYLIGGGRTAISSQSLDKYLNLEKRITISLKQPVPIHIRYFTCTVTNGQLHFYPDIYKKDNVLIKTIYRQPVF